MIGIDGEVILNNFGMQPDSLAKNAAILLACTLLLSLLTLFALKYVARKSLGQQFHLCCPRKAEAR